ncbi:hypothetical protein BC834DRAFT_848718 [Gloeopeniophorella convolvens]|nr:hypothetical protein BC834DRAFT_848718 [Gloeopeniophorella convolvens]
MLQDLREGHPPEDTSPKTNSDRALDLLRDHARLRVARDRLTLKSHNKSLDPTLRMRVTAMLGALNLFLDPVLQYPWGRSSMIAATAQGHGITCVRAIRRWILNFVWLDQLPAHQYSRARWSVLDDEDIAQELQHGFTEHAKWGYIKAKDIIEIVESPEMQARFIALGVSKTSILETTVRRWLKKLEWRYGKEKKGMYVDSHKRADVVAYCQEFTARWQQYEWHFHLWNNDGTPLPHPIRFPVPGCRFRLILIMHDESTFYQNDQH